MLRNHGALASASVMATPAMSTSGSGSGRESGAPAGPSARTRDTLRSLGEADAELLSNWQVDEADVSCILRDRMRRAFTGT
jgi:hypothetical protein